MFVPLLLDVTAGFVNAPIESETEIPVIAFGSTRVIDEIVGPLFVIL